MFVYVESIRAPAVRWEVLSYDASTKSARLRGQYGAEFTRVISKDALEKYGYKVVKSDKELPLVAPTAAGPKSVGTIADESDPKVEIGKKRAK